MKKITPKVRNLLLILIIAGFTLNLNANNLTPNISNFKNGDNTSLVLFEKGELNLNFKNSFSDRLLHKLETYSLKYAISIKIFKIDSEDNHDNLSNKNRQSFQTNYNTFPLIVDFHSAYEKRAIAISISFTNTPATCSSKADGSLSANVSGGQPPYTYKWTGPNSFTATTATINNIRPGSYTVEVTDANNVVVSQPTSLSFNDPQKPTISAPADKTVNADNNKCTASGVTLGNPTTSDNCGVKNVGNDAPSVFPLGTTTVTWTVTDDSDNTQTATQTVTVKDNQKPTISAPAAASGTTNVACTSTNVNLGSPIVSDNCTAKANLTVTNNAPSAFPIGNTTVTWTVKDAANNTATATQIVTVTDNINPTITAPAAASGTTNVACTSTNVNLGSPVVADNCTAKANLTVTNNAPSAFPIGNTTVTWMVKDEANNTATATQIVTVTDNINPTITAPAAASGTANVACTSTNVNLGSPVVADNCTAKANLTVTNNAPSAFPIGNTTVTWTVKDEANNTATATQIVTVTDNINPTITAPVDQTINADTNKCTASGVSLGTPSTADNCGVKSVTNNAPATFPLGETTITWTVTDNSDNTQTATQKVIVEDKQAPSTPTLSNIENWSCGKEITNFPTTTDNCSGEITGTTTDPLVYGGFGEFIITWTFTDNANNSTTATQTIIIPEPTVDIPSINGNEYCNEASVPSVAFTGNTLNNKRYEWSYKSDTGSNVNIGLPASGTGNIPEFTAKNNSSDIINVVFTVVPFGNSCEGIPITYTISIKPTPTITKPENITLCAGKEISFSNFIPSVQGTKFTIESSNTDIQFTTNNKGNITGINYDTNIEATINTIVTVTPEKDCIGPAETFNVTINPRPRFEFDVNYFTFCNGVLTNPISFENEIPFGKITYDITGGSSIGISNKSGVTQISSFTPVNNGTTSIIKNIIVTPKANGCAGEPIEIPVKVMPSPIVNASFTKNICSGEVTNIVLSSPVANTEFIWTVDAPTGIAGASQSTEPSNNISQQLINNTSTAQVVTYKVTPKAETCPGTTIPIKITVNPTPSFEITVPECIVSVDLTNPTIKNNSALNYSYWTDVNATAALTNPTKVGIGTYYIKGTSNSGCSFIEEVVIDKIQPVINNLADAPSEICSGEAFNYLPVSNLGETVISWSREAIGENPATDSSGRNNANPNESLINKTGSPITATYIFTLVNNGCTNNTAVEVIIQPAPQLINESIADICNGSSINYTPKSTLSNSTISWRRNAFEGNSASSGSGTINEILYNDTGVEIGVTYFISITSPKGCTVEESISFSLLSGPKVTATASKNDLCAGETIDLTSTFEGEQSVEPVLIDENFNGSTGNWLPINNSTGGSSNNSAWVTRSGTYNMNYGSVRSDGSRFYISDSDAQGQNGKTRTILQYSKPINTNGYSSLQLSFWQDYRDWNNNDRGQVQISTDQSNWVTVETIDGPGHRGEQLTIDLSGYINQSSIYIRFRYIADWGYWWAIDDVKLTGEGSTVPDVTWTSSTNPDWTSKDPNPSNISVSRTTIFTATYTDPDIECPGVGTVEVRVKDPLQPEIIANYCSLDQTNQVLLSANGTYDSYRWVASGQTISTSESLQVGLAQTYTLFVTKDGCEASTSITPNENLIINGDFENGNTSFNTVYNYVQDDPNSRREMYPEGTYSVGVNAYNYHNNFSGLGHGGRGNFMIVNGDRSIGNIVWQSNTLDIIPDTDYYFSAWTSNVNPASPARLRIQILIPGNNTPVEESTLGDLTNETVGNWINFYNPELWNSGNNSKVIVRIINENPTAGGNDFGIDDISFAAFRSFDFEFNPENNGPICENETLELSANLDGGRLPITFEWTGPNNFSRSKTITEESERTAADTIQIANTTPEMAGEYSLKITDFYGCNLETKSTLVTIIEKAKVFAGEDLEICSNQPLIDLSSASIEHPTVNSGFWTTLDGNNSRFENPNQINTSYTPNQEEIDLGLIKLVLTSAPDSGNVCEIAKDTIEIKFNRSPEIELIPSNVTCFEENNGKIAAEILESTGTAPFTYIWTNNNSGETFNGQTINNLAAGSYSVEVTDAKGCTVSGDTIINQPNKLIVDQPIQLEEASCFDEFGAVVAIGVNGGLFEDQVLDPENILYQLSILDSEGNEVSVEPESINYDMDLQRFVIRDLKGGASYTFLVSTGDCNAEVKTYTTLTPPVINAGNVPENLDCGVNKILLSASPIDPTIGVGSWTYGNGENDLFEDPNAATTSFTGKPGENYTLTWTVTPNANPDCQVSKSLEIKIPNSCSQLNFDGIDDFVDLGDNYDMGGKDFSVEAWVKPNTISGINTIISKRIPNDLSKGYDLILNNGAPSFRVRNKSVVATIKIKNDRWYHIAGVYSSAKIQLYVDGIEVQSNTNNIPDGTGNIDEPCLIGAAYSPENISESKDHFNGFIEEVRVWDKPITKDQIHFFMNQRLVKNGTLVDGSVLSKDLNLPNSPALPDWNSLQGYYQLLAENELIKDGYTSNLGSAGENAKGILKNIEKMQENTAPLPYVLNSINSNWFTKATWKLPLDFNGISKDFQLVDVWDAPNSIGINGEKINWNIVQLNGKSVKNPAGNDIQLLALLDDGGSLNMEGSNENSGSGLTITHYLDLDGKIDLNGESQLVQTQGSILEKTSAGYIERDQQGTANSFNYNYWSSPVSLQNAGTNSGYTISSVMLNGTDLSKPIPMTFVDGAYAADDAAVNITTYWLYKFRGTASIYSEWKYVGKNGALLAGEGFTMKGTSGNAAIKDRQNYTFKGKPNNGDISLNIGKDQNYLLGNPYPSALDADQFIKDNLKTSNGGNNSNGNIFNGALYFWDHFAGKTHNLAEYIGGYATYNLSGGVPAVATDARINNTGESSEDYFGNNAKIPQKYIPVGQGFFVNTVLDPAVSGNITVDGGDVVFNNGQRAFAKETKADSQFLSQEKPKTKGQEKQTDTRPKIRLVYESPKGFNRQILVTADENTTNDFDLGYDAMLNDNNAEDMYWYIKDHEFVIQGVPNFNKDQVLPLGVKLKEKGELTIKINALDYIKDDVEIYLKDIVDSTYHDLRASDFVTTIEGGTYNNKYALVFQKPKDPNPDTGEDTDTDPNGGTDGGTDESPTDNPEDIDSISEIDVMYSMDKNMLRVLNPSEIMVEKVELYNMLGQRLQVYKSMSKDNSIDVPLKNYPKATYVVKVRSINGTISKTILFKR